MITNIVSIIFLTGAAIIMGIQIFKLGELSVIDNRDGKITLLKLLLQNNNDELSQKDIDRIRELIKDL